MVCVSIASQNFVCVFYRMFLSALLGRGTSLFCKRYMSIEAV